MRDIKFRCFAVQENEMIAPDDVLTIYNNRKLNESLISDDDHIFEQFTGLKDRNGVDIYEGDVVKYLTHTAHVFWSPQDFGFVHYNEVIGGYAGLSFFTGYKDFEVIGNIHQNPELLEQKQ